MMTEGMDVVGSVGIVGVVPCIRCTPGEHCEMSEIRKMRGPDTPRSSVKIPKLEDQKEVVAALIALGMEIGKGIENSQKK